MPLAGYFEEQLEQLRVFMEFPGTTLHMLRHEPDLRPMMLRLLAGLDQQADNPHVMTLCATPFENREQYFRDLLAEIGENNQPGGDALGDEDRVLPAAPRAASPAGPRALHDYAARVADCFPRRSIGSYVIVIAPDEIADETGFAAAMEALAERPRSPWVKFIVLDRRINPLLGDLHLRNPRVSLQTFHLSEEEIERRVTRALNGNRLTPAEQLRHAAMLAGFHVARREFAKAAALQRTSVEAARRAESPRDIASSLYNLSSTHLAAAEYAEAEACCAEAIDICIAEQMDSLLAMVLTNLGVALQHQGRADEADESFATARRLCRLQNDRPSEAYVLDAQADALLATGRPERAEEGWHEALAVYDGVTSDDFCGLRAAGRDGIHDKLRRLYQQTGDEDKLAALPEPAVECAHG